MAGKKVRNPVEQHCRQVRRSAFEPSDRSPALVCKLHEFEMGVWEIV